jgi:hypothetical protein
MSDPRDGDERPPIVSRVNGYDVIEEDDGSFGVWNCDAREAGPFRTFDEARDAASRLEPRRG